MINICPASVQGNTSPYPENKTNFVKSRNEFEYFIKYNLKLYRALFSTSHFFYLANKSCSGIEKSTLPATARIYLRHLIVYERLRRIKVACFDYYACLNNLTAASAEGNNAHLFR